METQSNLIDKESSYTFLIDLEEDFGGTQFTIKYRITEDNYLELIESIKNENKHEVIVNQKRTTPDLLFELGEELRGYIEKQERYLLGGSVNYLKSSIFTEKHFLELKEKTKKEYEERRVRAKENRTPLIKLIVKNNLNPYPLCFTEYSWTSVCPKDKSHQLMISTLNDEWSCFKCGKKGGIEELQKWIKDIPKIIEQERLSKMMKELKENDGAIESEETFKWWMNRY